MTKKKQQPTWGFVQGGLDVPPSAVSIAVLWFWLDKQQCPACTKPCPKAPNSKIAVETLEKFGEEIRVKIKLD